MQETSRKTLDRGSFEFGLFVGFISGMLFLVIVVEIITRILS